MKLKMEIKPFKIYGIDKVPKDKVDLLNIGLSALEQFISKVPGVTSVKLQSDYSFFIEGDHDVLDKVKDIHPEAIFTVVE